MKEDVDAIRNPQAQHEGRTNLLLRHCLSLGVAENRVPARVRLDQAIGPELARKLIASLTAHSRR
jgi:hypothetical protein